MAPFLLDRPRRAPSAIAPRRAPRGVRLPVVLSLPLALAGALPGVVAAQEVPAAASGGARPRPAVGRTFSTNPLALPFGVVSGELEQAIGRRGLAIGLGGLTTFGREPQVLNDGGSDVFRSLQLKLKYYPREEGLRGFAVGVTAGVAHERELWWGSAQYDGNGRLLWEQRVTRARTAPTVGATLDYNVFLGKQRRFLVGLGVGARRALGVPRGGGPLEDPLIDPRLQIGFGF